MKSLIVSNIFGVWLISLFLVLLLISYIIHRCSSTKLNYMEWMKNSFGGITFIFIFLVGSYFLLLINNNANVIFRLVMLIAETIIVLVYVNFCEWFFINWFTQSVKIILSCFLIILIDYFVISLAYIGFCHFNLKYLVDINSLLPKGNGSQLMNKDYLSIFMVIVPIGFSGIGIKLRKLGEEKNKN